MPPIRSVAILFHERHEGVERANYRVWALAANWRDRGVRVDLVRGVDRPVDADLLIPQVDVSYVPDRYWSIIQSHPNVVNRSVRDIRKTRYSTIRVGPGDVWDGPVLVKTVGNCGGIPDVWHSPRKGPSLWSRVRTRMEKWTWVQRRLVGWVRTMKRYRVFASLRQVPARVFRNPHLIVEKFIPERRKDGYVLRQWVMFGSRSIGRLLTSTEPLIKSYNSDWEVIEPDPPAEIVRWRRELGVDFAKMDYVMHEGRGVLLDLNVTPTLRHNVRDAKIIASAREMSEGIEQFER